jgi:hypothetical protein
LRRPGRRIEACGYRVGYRVNYRADYRVGYRTHYRVSYRARPGPVRGIRAGLRIVGKV